MKEVAEQKLGTKWVGGSKKKHSPWWNEELRNLVKEKMKKLRSWLRNRTHETRLEYVIARNTVNRKSESK